MGHRHPETLAGSARLSGGTAAGEPAAVGSPTAACTRRRGPPAGAEGLLRLHRTLLGLEPEVLHVLPELLVEPLLHAGAQPLAPPVCRHGRASVRLGARGCGAGTRQSTRADAGPRQATKGSAPQNRARPASATKCTPAHTGPRLVEAAPGPGAVQAARSPRGSASSLPPAYWAHGSVWELAGRAHSPGPCAPAVGVGDWPGAGAVQGASGL